MAVLTGVRVNVTDDVGVGAGEGQMSVHLHLLLEIVTADKGIRKTN